MSELNRRYENGEIAIIWQPALCIHATNCFRALPDVFKPSQRPWVDPSAATTEELVDAIERCPSGALSFERLDGRQAR